MSDAKVWVLFGDTGEYSDYTEWVVRAYTDEEAATKDCETLNALLRAEGVHSDDDHVSRLSWDERKAVIARLRAHDTNASLNYTGTRYFVHEIPLVETPQVKEPAPPQTSFREPPK